MQKTGNFDQFYQCVMLYNWHGTVFDTTYFTASFSDLTSTANTTRLGSHKTEMSREAKLGEK